MRIRSRAPRWVTVAVAAAVIPLALASCSASNGSSSTASSASSGSFKGKTLNVYIGTEPANLAAQKQWFTTIAAEFKAETGATVDFETYSSGDQEQTKIQTSVVSGQGPDLYVIGTTFTPTAYASGAFVTMTAADWKAVGGKGQFIPATLGISGPSATDQIGIPLHSRPFVMAYNKKLLKDAGISAPATTWADLQTQAKELTKNGVYGLAIAYKDNFDPWKYIWAMSLQNGTQIIDGSKARVNSPAVRSAYDTYFGWLEKDKVVNPASVGWSNAQAMASFAEGKAAYFLMATGTSVPTLEASAVKNDYAFAVMPTSQAGTGNPNGGKAAASILSGDNMVIPKYSKNQDLAFRFVKFLSTEKQQVAEYKAFGEFPVTTAAAQSVASANPALAPIVAASKASYATPFSGAWGNVELDLQGVVSNALPALSSGTLTDSHISSLLNAAQTTSQTAVTQAVKAEKSK